MSRNHQLQHPSGADHFGLLDDMRSGAFRLPAGPVLLLMGEHFGPNRGWGARHIWHEHQREIAARGWDQFEDVAKFVALIVCAGTPVFFEGPGTRNTRLAVVRSRTGTAILESRDRRDGHIWSVVTAFAGTKTHGTRVGTVRSGSSQ
ncbi:MAG: hypothetical protein LCH92_15915 [Proteobacteria bacterium]|nr:hypothetical protein [Pseudomonadota bacterium]